MNAVLPDDGTAAARLLAVVEQLTRDAHPGQSVPVTLQSSLEDDLGLDSMARAELMQRVGTAFGLDLPPEALAEADTPQSLLRFLGRADIGTVISPAVLPAPSHAGLPDQAGTLLEILEWHAERQAERTHILLHDGRRPDEAISYRALFDAAHSMAEGLAARGVQPRQAVAIMLPTGRDYLATFFGVLMAGAIPVPIYPPARVAQLDDHLRRHARILSNSGAVLMVTLAEAGAVAVMLQAEVPGLQAVVAPEDLRRASAGLHYRPRPDDIAFLQYTSGSTGDPKGVVLTHANLLANVRALGQAAHAVPNDVFVSWLPLYHDMGLIGAWFGSLYHGMPLVLMSPLAFLARPAIWLQAITRYRGTISAAPNFAYELCIRHVRDATTAGLDLSRWRLALNGAEPVSAATLERFAARFAACGFHRQALTPVYGLAESSVGLAFPPLDRGPRLDTIHRLALDRDRRAEPAAGTDAVVVTIPSCGRPLPGHAIRIVDDAGCELPERQVGHLQFRGPSATAGYFRNPDATRKLLREGWLDSGDEAYTAGGEVYVTGRVKDLIKRGGRNLYPYDLEEAAGNLPGIRKGCVAVFGSPDQASGAERLVIMAETRQTDDTGRNDLRRQLNRLAADIAGSPADDIVLLPPHSILKTSSGKIRRLACREAYERGMPAVPAHGLRVRTAALALRATRAHAAVLERRALSWLYGLYAWLALAALALPCATLIMAVRRPAAGRRIARGAARLLFRLVGVPLTAEGLDRLPKQPHVLIVNHASYLDAIVLTALLPAVPGYAFVAKREFASQAAMRKLLDGLGTLFVERKAILQEMEDVHSIATALRRGESVVVFPEGTFDREAGLMPFHAGAFAAAAEAEAPLALSGLRGTRSALRGDSWWPRRNPITFEVGQVLPPPRDAWADNVRAALEARSAVAALSGEFVRPDLP